MNLSLNLSLNLLSRLGVLVCGAAICSATAFALSVPAQDSSSFGFELITTGLAPAEVSQMQSLLQKTNTLLPPSLRSRVGRSIRVLLTDSKNYEGRVDVNGQQIEVQHSLLTSALKGESNSKFPHVTADQELLATLLHEATHVYDNQLSQDQIETAELCQDPAYFESNACLNRRKTFLSTRHSFLSVAGWYNNQFKMTAREPDPYEATAPKETLAVNMEYFLLDPQYSCRRPTLARYLRAHFAFDPFPGANCAPEQTAINPEGTSPQQLLIPVPWSQVYEVDYLLASPGKSADSILGHTMLRLVICAPGHPLSVDCRKDVSHHLVLSFRGSVTDLHESAWKGLTGQYPSRLFVLGLASVINEYAESELRNLTAYPLKLSRTQLEAVLSRAMEYHWNYRGQYYFVSNNCATETMHLLRSALLQATPHDPLTRKLLDADAVTPTGVLGQLVDMGLADSKPASLDPESGMYFASYAAQFQMAMDKINKITDNNFKLSDWLASSSQYRRQVFDSLPLTTYDAKSTLALDASFYLLENSVSRMVENVDANKVAQKIEQQAATGGSNATDELMQSRNDLINPGSFVVGPGQYGLPTDQEIQNGLQSLQGLANEQGHSVDVIESSIQTLLAPQDWAELNDLRTNIQFYLQQMQRDLNRGGNP